MKRFKRFSLVLVSLICVFSSTQPIAAASFRFSVNDLSSDGKRAFDDLARCLNSNNKLDAFYLIDESASLKDTDGSNKRAEILKSSLIQLSTLRNDLEVNYAVGFFSDGYKTWKPWSKIDAKSAESAAGNLEQKVRSSNTGLSTDWKKGIEKAARELSAQRQKTNACQILIWLTDGGLDLSTKAAGSQPVQNNPKNLDAFNYLCDESANSLRQSRVTVLGVLLKSEQDLQSKSADARKNLEQGMALLLPIIEGSGPINLGNSEVKQCGKYPIPANFAAGALLIAEDPVALAFQFLKVGAYTAGGTHGDLTDGNPGTFLIEEGISRFKIITTSPSWKLTDPKGHDVKSGNGVTFVESAGATQVSVNVDASKYGKWSFSFKDGSSNELVLFSGLDLKLDEGELIAGTPGRISGKVVSEFSGQPVNLDVYSVANVSVQEILNSGQSNPAQPAQINSGNFFKIENFTASPDQGQVELRVTLRVKTKSGINLAPVSVSKILDVRLSSNYPSLDKSPIALSTLAGRKGKAIGSAVFKGPNKGSGKICIVDNPTIVNDSIERAESFIWKSPIGLDSKGCVTLSNNETKKIGFEVTNKISADSQIQAEVPVIYYSEQEPNRQFTLRAPIEFQSTKPGVGGWAIELILILLGIGLPLLLIYVLTLLTTKIALGQNVQHASWPVKIDSLKGIQSNDGSALTPKAEDYKYLPDRPDSRSISEPAGEFRAKVSKLVFPAPWFEIQAKPGTRLVTMVAPPAQMHNRFASGSIAAIKGNIDSVWALEIKDHDLVSLGAATSIPAQLHVYKRNNLANKNQFMERFMKVVTTPGIWNQVVSIIPAVNQEIISKQEKNKTKKFSSKSKNKSDSSDSPPPGSGGSFPPPPPGSGGSFPPPPPGSGGSFPPPPPGSGGSFPPPPPGSGGSFPPPPPGGSRP